MIKHLKLINSVIIATVLEKLHVIRLEKWNKKGGSATGILLLNTQEEEWMDPNSQGTLLRLSTKNL